jgi:iron complex outermembrane receptor protein
MQARYIDSGLYNVLWIDPSDPRYNPTTTDPSLEQYMANDNTIDSATYLSLSGRYRLPMRTERSWELFATINNVLDENPPLAPDGAYPTMQRSSIRSAGHTASVSAVTSAAATISGG